MIIYYLSIVKRLDSNMCFYGFKQKIRAMRSGSLEISKICYCEFVLVFHHNLTYVSGTYLQFDNCARLRLTARGAQL